MSKAKRKKATVQLAGSAVRVLRDIVVDGIEYLCDQVVSFPDPVLAGLQANGSIDPHEDAVRHCVEVLGKEVVEHAVAAIVDAVEPDDVDDEIGDAV